VTKFHCSLSDFSVFLCSQAVVCFLLLLSGRSVKEFVKACKKATGVDIKVDYLPRRPGDYAEVFSDPSKIYRELNWTAQYTDLQKSLQTAWRWQKSHQNGYGSPLVMAS
jgi:UDP-arabinose 4-epimerase